MTACCCHSLRAMDLSALSRGQHTRRHHLNDCPATTARYTRPVDTAHQRPCPAVRSYRTDATRVVKILKFIRIKRSRWCTITSYTKVKRQKTESLINTFNHIDKTFKRILDVYDGLVFDYAYAVTRRPTTQVTKFTGTPHTQQCATST